MGDSANISIRILLYNPDNGIAPLIIDLVRLGFVLGTKLCSTSSVGVMHVAPQL